MYPVLVKEISSFFSSLIGYTAIIVFVLVTGLFLFVFKQTSILDYGFASLENLFMIAPFILMFLIPAITMRAFSEEIHSGSFEILSSKPITLWDIVLGKYLASAFVVLIAILPTLLYYFTVYQLGTTKGNIDSGAVLGSYFGLILLAISFNAIGLFCSTLTTNQIVAFIVGVFACFMLFQGLDYIAALDVFFGSSDNFIEQLGMNSHFNSLGRGVIDLKDVIYFISLIFLFLFLTHLTLKSKKW